MALSENDLKMVRNFLFDVRRKWYDIGIELGVRKTELDIIKDHSFDPSDCLREMIAIWLKSYDFPPTWQALAEALESPVIREKKLAAEGT